MLFPPHNATASCVAPPISDSAPRQPRGAESETYQEVKRKMKLKNVVTALGLASATILGTAGAASATTIDTTQVTADPGDVLQVQIPVKSDDQNVIVRVSGGDSIYVL